MRKGVLWLVATLSAVCVWGRGLPSEVKREVGEVLDRIVKREVSIKGSVEVERISDAGGTLSIYANIDLSYYPFREQNIPPMLDSVRACLPARWRGRRIRLVTDRKSVDELIPLPMRFGIDRGKTTFFTHSPARPLVERISSPNRPTEGLAGRHIALWQSHGLYYDQNQGEWSWQRALLWQTVEDLYTQSYVLPYLVPMLENAGANVLLPRERDVQCREVVVDNDGVLGGASAYDEYTGARVWFDGTEPGFAHRRPWYVSGQNPFAEGSYRATETVADSAQASFAVWTPDIPAEGEYAVYVSYRSLPRSTDDALYTVVHLGGESSFRVNQRMGGGTWIYLGTFRFAAGADARRGHVRLSNLSAHAERLVTADGVKIGGGYGNVARIPAESKRSSEIVCEYVTSGHPRFTEGARYWLQWAGCPDSVYNFHADEDDYKDDYKARAHWVNYLLGGSERLPEGKGLNVPLDLAFAFHSDAGVEPDDGIVGTLGIFFTRENGGEYHGGASRYMARDLTDMVLTQICDDVRALHEPQWVRRGLWNRSYYEARVPAVPTMLLELLSHQNFADMRYGLDPRFHFTVSRAIYKGMLRYLSFQYGQPCTVQPLPVTAFAARLSDDDHALLSWRAVVDPLEESARPERYAVYTRVDGGAFDNGRVVEDTCCRLPVEQGRIYSYRVTALNAGGESFPSETLSLCRVPGQKGCVLVVNGFDRVSGPESFRGDSLAGFINDLDHGVPYVRDISFTGVQREYRRSQTFAENLHQSLGASHGDYAQEVIAGNTFDYPLVHGRAIVAAGYSFVSCSARAVASGDVRMEDYLLCDLILGKQRTTLLGSEVAFKTFPDALQRAVREFTAAGGAILVSGSFVGSDLWNGAQATEQDRLFARQVLRYRLLGGGAARRGRVRSVPSPAGAEREEYRFNTELGPEHYVVEAPDALAPVGESAFVMMRYCENNLPAATLFDGDYKTVVMGFPFEAIVDERERERLMGMILEFFEPKK